MTDPFIGEIRMFAGNFAPRGWSFCDGQLLQVNQNEALFSLLGTIYGGDGRTTFALPDLRGRVPVHQGTGPGLPPRRIGLKAGVEEASVSVAELASHSHAWHGSGDLASDTSPAGNLMATAAAGNLYGSTTPGEAMDGQAIVSTSGGGQTHDNVMPFQCLHFIIALFGTFPSRN